MGNSSLDFLPSLTNLMNVFSVLMLATVPEFAQPKKDLRSSTKQRSIQTCLQVYILKRTVGNESKGEEKGFSLAEMLKKANNLLLRDLDLQEAPPSIVMSEAEGYKYRPQANCKALRPLPESLQPILSAYSSESLQHPQQHQQSSQLFPPIGLSADDGNDKQLSSLE